MSTDLLVPIAARLSGLFINAAPWCMAYALTIKAKFIFKSGFACFLFSGNVKILSVV
jgi:hypothetical protein